MLSKISIILIRVIICIWVQHLFIYLKIEPKVYLLILIIERQFVNFYGKLILNINEMIRYSCNYQIRILKMSIF